MAVAKNHRPPGAYIVKVGPSVRIGQMGTLCAGDKPRGLSYGAKGPNRGIDAAGDVLYRTLKKLF